MVHRSNTPATDNCKDVGREHCTDGGRNGRPARRRPVRRRHAAAGRVLGREPSRPLGATGAGHAARPLSRCPAAHRCGARTSSAWPGRTSPATSTPKVTCSGCSTPMLRVTRKGMRLGWSALPGGLRAARRLGLLGRPLPPPPEEARLRGGVHSLRRDAAAIGHHYDVGNDFYRIVLGPSMTYSCARFSDEGMDLTAAQASKHELICRKLGLPEQPGARLLDVGCGWGSMAIHAALHHDVSVVGITISRCPGRPGPQASRRGRCRRPGRHPPPGLPRARRRAVRRDLVDRDVGARRLRPAWPSTTASSTTRCGRRAACSTTPSARSAARRSAAARSSAGTSSPTAS